MSTATKEMIDLMEILPESDQNLALELVRKLVLAWDPDFTKVTDEERRNIEEAEQSGFVDEEDINWDDLSAVF